MLRRENREQIQGTSGCAATPSHAVQPQMQLIEDRDKNEGNQIFDKKHNIRNHHNSRCKYKNKHL